MGAREICRSRSAFQICDVYLAASVISFCALAIASNGAVSSVAKSSTRQLPRLLGRQYSIAMAVEFLSDGSDCGLRLGQHFVKMGDLFLSRSRDGS